MKKEKAILEEVKEKELIYELESQDLSKDDYFETNEQETNDNTHIINIDDVYYEIKEKEGIPKKIDKSSSNYYPKDTKGLNRLFGKSNVMPKQYKSIQDEEKNYVPTERELYSQLTPEEKREWNTLSPEVKQFNLELMTSKGQKIKEDLKSFNRRINLFDI